MKTDESEPQYECIICKWRGVKDNFIKAYDGEPICDDCWGRKDEGREEMENDE